MTSLERESGLEAPFPPQRRGRVPWGGVGAVGKWSAAPTVKSLAAAGHLSTAVVIADPR